MKETNINILFSFDDTTGNYTRHCAVTILSILNTNKKHKIKFWIMTSYISKENINELKRIVGLYNQEIEFIIHNDIISDELKKIIINKKKITRGAWYYLFFPKYIKGIDRILYLDCDILVMKDISSIYNMDMHGNSIAGYYDKWNTFSKKRRAFGMKNYVNSGVLLFDVKKYDVNKINVEKMKEINTNYGKYFSGADEEKMNLIFKDEIFVGERSMNYQITNKFFNHGIDTASIIHCMQKPYIQYSGIPQRFVDIYHNYLNGTKWKGYPIKKASYGYLHHICCSLYEFCNNFIIRIFLIIQGKDYY